MSIEIRLGKTLILEAKAGDVDAMERIFYLFFPMFENRSRICGIVDEDLWSEQALAFMKCLLHFTVEEAAFADEFKRWKET